jgi:hypothetical protein
MRRSSSAAEGVIAASRCREVEEVEEEEEEDSGDAVANMFLRAYNSNLCIFVFECLLINLYSWCTAFTHTYTHTHTHTHTNEITVS